MRIPQNPRGIRNLLLLKFHLCAATLVDVQHQCDQG